VLKSACEGHGKTAVIGAQGVIIDANAQELRTKDNKMRIGRGDVITIDGSTGLVYVGEMPTITPIHDEEFQTILHWADKYKRMQVLANADTAEDVKKAIELGAEGVGLCRTEHMFFQADRINFFRQLILAESEEDRKRCLQSILSLQQQDFVEIFRAAENHEVVIRLLDAPIHEFLPDPNKPDYDHELELLGDRLGWSKSTCRARIGRLRECNPMMGCRGCRQAIVHPDLIDMQTRAIMGAYLQVHKEGIRVRPQIMIPMVFSNHEIDTITPVILLACKDVYRQTGLEELECCDIGAMLELPRACLRADKLVTAQHMKFVSFGTNDLTQMVFGISRDDTEQFMVSCSIAITWLDSYLLHCCSSLSISTSIWCAKTHSYRWTSKEWGRSCRWR
jgi:pyruvate,orthophosphate dikinase